VKNALPAIIPLFPLPNVVFFPKMPMPLHVFEPRYLRMTSDSLEGDRVIGMVLLKPGWEPDYEGRPPVYPVGCAGRIEQSEKLPDGRYNLVLRGASRFRIGLELPGAPYRRASVEGLFDAVEDKGRLDAMRRKVLAAIGQAADGPSALVLQDELPHDIFVNALGQTLALSPVERQSLLDCDSILDRYQRLLEILEFLGLEQRSGQRKVVH
jgi:Lon protease-like protein